MRIEDLQRGDYVLIEWGSVRAGVHVRNLLVATIHYDGEEIGERGLYSHKLPKVMPMPITEPSLLCMGFKKEGDSLIKKNGIAEVVCKGGVFDVRNGVYQFHGRLEAFHELQRVLRICRLEEMAEAI